MVSQSRHFKAATAMVQDGLATAQTGEKSWCCLHDIGCSGLQELSHHEGLYLVLKKGKIPWRRDMSEAVVMKSKVQWRPQKVEIPGIWNVCQGKSKQRKQVELVQERCCMDY